MKKRTKTARPLRLMFNNQDKVINEADDTHGHKLDAETEAAQIKKYHKLYDSLNDGKKKNDQEVTK